MQTQRLSCMSHAVSTKMPYCSASALALAIAACCCHSPLARPTLDRLLSRTAAIEKGLASAQGCSPDKTSFGQPSHPRLLRTKADAAAASVLRRSTFRRSSRTSETHSARDFPCLIPDLLVGTRIRANPRGTFCKRCNATDIVWMSLCVCVHDSNTNDHRILVVGFRNSV